MLQLLRKVTGIKESTLPISPRNYGLIEVSKGQSYEDIQRSLSHTVCVSSHANYKTRVINKEDDIEIDIEIDEFSPPFKIIYTAVTPHFSIFNTTIFIICCLLYFIIINFSQGKEIIAADIERIKHYYLNTCLKSITTQNKLKTANEDVGFNSLAVQQSTNFSLFQTIATYRTDEDEISKFPIIQYDCNELNDTIPCGFFFTTTKITIDLLKIFQDKRRQDVLNSILQKILDEQDSVTVHSLNINSEEQIMITLKKIDERTYIEYELYANFFACPIFCLVLYLFQLDGIDAEGIDDVIDEMIKDINSIESLKHYLTGELELITEKKIISLSVIALNKRLFDKNCDNLIREKLLIGENMIKTFNLQELCRYLSNVDLLKSLNILSLTCQTIFLEEDDNYKLYRKLAHDLYIEHKDMFKEINMTPQMIEALLMSNDFFNYSRVLERTKMNEREKSLFSKNFPKIKMDNLKKFIFDQLLEKFIIKYRLSRSKVDIQDLIRLAKKKRVRASLEDDDEEYYKIGGSKYRKRKTHKKRKRKTNKKRKPRNFSLYL